MLHDCQAKSGTAAFARAGFVDAVKTLKDAGQVFRSDTRAEVAYEELNTVFMLMRADNDFFSVLSIADSIANKVGKNLMHGITIGQHGPIWNVFNYEFNLDRAGIFLQGRRGFSKQVTRRLWPQIELLLARFHSRKHQEIFRETPHALRIATNDLKKIAS